MRKIWTIILFAAGVLMAQSPDTTNVVAGWNLVGATETGTSAQIISTIPANIIIDMFGFTPGIGYEEETSVVKGSGYWVKVSQNGKIIWKTGGTNGGAPCPGISTVSYGGKVYNTVQIGTQCWLKENLDYGTMIPGTQTSANNGVVEKYCYLDDPNYCSTYGALYQWNEAMEYTLTAGTQGICPTGWHIPTLVELEGLSAAVYMSGNALKAVGQGSGAGAGVNTSGFAAMLSGRRYSNGTYGSVGAIGVFWCSNQYNDFYGMYMHLYNTGTNIGLTDLSKKYGFSIRCIKD